MSLVEHTSDSSIDDELDSPDPPVRGKKSAEKAPAKAKAKAKKQPAPRAPATPRRWRSIIHSSAGMITSMIVHLVTVVVMAMFVVDTETVREVATIIAEVVKLEDRPEEIHKIELETQMELVEKRNDVKFSTASVAGEQATIGPPGSNSATLSEPVMDKNLLEQMVAPEVKISGISADIPSVSKIIIATPDGAIGDARMIADSYERALDQIAQELLWMMDKGPLLTMWCFDQSESMKDDQKEIRERIEHVYAQLGLVTREVDGKMVSAVTSYGENFAIHTPKPTSIQDEIRAAINAVPTDPSGKEMMCQAVGRTISHFRPFAAKARRQMALILVTDESGDRTDNDRYLEQAIAEAKASQCRIYILGREAIFGYPYAHMRWIHPQTKHHHWLQIDRGPETAFVEQLQTDGFHRRTDALPSGYGPYEQTRMARETGGIFFLLPSIESDLVHGDKRRYGLEAMGPYPPDLRTRYELGEERDRSPLRTGLTKVIYDLNPYNPEAAKIINMRMTYSPAIPDLVRQARAEQAKMIVYLNYLAVAEKAVEKMRPLREQEGNPRWQANYDLLYGQLIAYQARIYEYGAYLEEFIKTPKIVPATKSPNLTHTHWDVGVRHELIAEEKSKPYIDRATAMFSEVIKKHPGTPWAARAELEIRRGFGVHLVPDYDPPPVPLPPGTVLIPVPKF